MSRTLKKEKGGRAEEQRREHEVARGGADDSGEGEGRAGVAGWGRTQRSQVAIRDAR